jgi:hypothetical protein
VRGHLTAGQTGAPVPLGRLAEAAHSGLHRKVELDRVRRRSGQGALRGEHDLADRRAPERERGNVEVRSRPHRRIRVLTGQVPCERGGHAEPDQRPIGLAVKQPGPLAGLARLLVLAPGERGHQLLVIGLVEDLAGQQRGQEVQPLVVGDAQRRMLSPGPGVVRVPGSGVHPERGPRVVVAADRVWAVSAGLLNGLAARELGLMATGHGSSSMAPLVDRQSRAGERRRNQGLAAVALETAPPRRASCEHSGRRVIPTPRDHPRPVAPSINTYTARAPRLLENTRIPAENRNARRRRRHP